MSNLENLLKQVIAIEPLLEKIHHAEYKRQIRGKDIAELAAAAVAANILSPEQGAQVLAVEKIKMQWLQVDDFENLSK